MTQSNVMEDGVPAAPSPLTLAELLQVLALGGRITLTVGDRPAITLLTAVPGSPPPDEPLGSSSCDQALSSVAPSSVGTAGGDESDDSTLTSASFSSGGICCGLPAAIPGPPPRKRDAPAPALAPFAFPPTSPVLAQDGKPEAVEVLSDQENEEDDDVGPWYTITRGRRVGVFSGWDTVSPLVVGVSGACYNRKGSRAQAEVAFARAVRDGNVSIIR